MSNPLLRPDDPRFRPKELSADNNPFAEGDAILDAEATTPARREGVFAAPGSVAERPFVPEYETTAESRGYQLVAIVAVAYLAALCGLGVNVLGYIFPILGLVPAGVTLFLAFEDLRTMRTGGRDRKGRPLTILALVLSVFIIIVLGLLITMFVQWEFSILPPAMK